MMNEKKLTIKVQGTAIAILTKQDDDYISLTDMVRNFDGGSALIEQWLKNKDTVLFLGVWEQINNPDFNSPEFEGIRNEAGRNSFYLSAKRWIESTGAKGLIAKSGRYGGTYAHKDIAFEFGSWLSPEFKLYLIKEFQRLKEDENRRTSLEWNLNRTLSKLNYRIHTDAIKAHIIPTKINAAQANFVYANEADVLNVALFGQTAKQWRDANPNLEGNMREFASVEQLLVLANIESMNAEFIRMKFPQPERLKKLNEIAITQLSILTKHAGVRKLNSQNSLADENKYSLKEPEAL
ncbi:MAG: KilA-N domain-containing protein [Legionellaceae bacterium]|nr:KilA-N domain-containing protein [Legionellaceae bacterium]